MVQGFLNGEYTTQLIDGEVMYLNPDTDEYVHDYEMMAYEAMQINGPTDFTGSDMLGCFVNMYSKHCLPGMVEFFMNAEEPEEGADRLTTWAKRGMNYNWFIYAFWGIPHYLIWTTWVEGRLSAAPEDSLPSFEPHLYDVLP